MNTEAYEEGYKAYNNYQHLSDCPYTWSEYNTWDNNFAEWERGYSKAQYDDNF